MATKKFQFILKTPEKTLFEGEITDVLVRCEGGFIQVMAHHADLTAAIAYSPVRINTEGGLDEFVVRRGVLSFDNQANKASLLVLHGEHKSDLNLVSAKDYLTFVEEQIAKGNSLSDFHLRYLENEKLAIEMQLEK